MNLCSEWTLHAPVSLNGIVCSEFSLFVQFWLMIRTVSPSLLPSDEHSLHKCLGLARKHRPSCECIISKMTTMKWIKIDNVDGAKCVNIGYAQKRPITWHYVPVLRFIFVAKWLAQSGPTIYASLLFVNLFFWTSNAVTISSTCRNALHRTPKKKEEKWKYVVIRRRQTKEKSKTIFYSLFPSHWIM